MNFGLSRLTNRRRARGLSLAVVSAIILILVCGASTPAWSQSRKGGAAAAPVRPGGVPRPGPMGAKALERLSKMPPAQRERVMSRLPEERRQRLQRQLEQYNNMTPDQRERLHRQVEAFQQLPPERQDAARKAFRRYNNLPPARQDMVRDELQTLRGMSPEERRARMDSDEFRGKFKRHEQKVLEELADIVPQP